MFRGGGGSCLKAAIYLIISFLLTACATYRLEENKQDECRIIETLSDTGEHKAVVDSTRAMVGDLSACSPDVVRKVSSSYNTVNKADSLVRQSFSRRKKGDLLGARESLQKALGVYPRYYWVQKLLRGLERSITIRVGELNEEADYLETQGDLVGAANRIRAALALTPGDADLQATLSRIENQKSKLEARELARRSMQRAETLLEHERFEEAETTLVENQAVMLLGEEAERVLLRVRKGKAEHAREEFGFAKRTMDSNEFEKAFFHLRIALKEGESEQDLKAEITEYVRVLGMYYYSRGELTRARKIWLIALESDPENPTLLKYFSEVEIRLDSLKKIKDNQRD